MRQKFGSGVIIFHRNEHNHIQFLLVQGYGNYWGFPKGHAEHNETHIQTALRELKEETQITNVAIVPDLKFREEYVIERKRGPSIFKKITYFVGEVKKKKAQRLRSEIKQLAWFDIEFAKQLVVPEKKVILDKVYSQINAEK
jgi:8-oxo-dGTP pyrophosphatase MutT (NUDIX family)